jgi:hypothetical protein
MDPVYSENYRGYKINIYPAEEHDSTLQGELFGYVITDRDGHDLDFFWGFLGNIDDVINASKDQVNYFAENDVPFSWPVPHDLDFCEE